MGDLIIDRITHSVGLWTSCLRDLGKNEGLCSWFHSTVPGRFEEQSLDLAFISTWHILVLLHIVLGPISQMSGRGTPEGQPSPGTVQRVPTQMGFKPTLPTLTPEDQTTFKGPCKHPLCLRNSTVSLKGSKRHPQNEGFLRILTDPF